MRGGLWSITIKTIYFICIKFVFWQDNLVGSELTEKQTVTMAAEKRLLRLIENKREVRSSYSFVEYIACKIAQVLADATLHWREGCKV